MGTAQTTATPQGPSASPQQSPFLSLTPMIVICAIFYFLIIRPQQKQEKDRKKMIDALKVGDRVLTSSGMYGVVTQIEGPVVTLKVAESTKIKFHRSAVTSIVTEDPTVAGNGERA